MGDRCYMEVRCLAKDKALFEELGFVSQDPEGCVVIDMVDEEANYAHSSEMPTNVPWIAEADAGDEYSACASCCDGENSIEVSRDGEFIMVRFSPQLGQPYPKDVDAAKAYLECLKKVNKMFDELENK